MTPPQTVGFAPTCRRRRAARSFDCLAKEPKSGQIHAKSGQSEDGGLDPEPIQD
jgi:hypothetical protein